MKAVREASADSRAGAASVAAERFGRLRHWLADPAVRVALVATIGLRVVLSTLAALTVVLQRTDYLRTFGLINGHSISTYSTPLNGLTMYIVGPWLRWDANNYLAIAAGGYNFSGSTAFFPLYPLLIRVISVPLGGNLPISALLISTAASFAMFMLLYRLIIRLTASDAAARCGVVVACLLPLSFFFMAPYTESLFLALSLGTILASLSGRWGAAATLAALASLTRQQGVLLSVLALPAIGTELEGFWKTRDFRLPQIRLMLSKLIAPLGLVLAPLAAYGAWIGFIHWALRQSAPWQALSSSNLWGQTYFWPGMGVLADVLHVVHDPALIVGLSPQIPLDAVAALIAAILLGLAWNRVPTELLLYLLACWCIAVVKVQTTGITTGAARYLLALLPLCFLPGLWLIQARWPVWFAIVTLAVLFTLRFFGLWVLWVWVN